METLPKQNPASTHKKTPHIIGIQTGKCPICKETKKLLLLRYGMSLCEDCLSVCIGILEHLQFGVIEKTPTGSPNKARPKTSRKPPVSKQAATKNAHASTRPS
jgi:hypothetical protein